MIGGRVIAELSVDEAQLAEVVAPMLSRSAGQTIEVQSVRREPSKFATLFPVEVLHVTLADHSQIRLFVKHFGEEQSDHPDKQVRDREIRIYEELLRGRGLPVVNYLGSRVNHDTARRELYLEHVDCLNLKYHALESWFDAVQALARLHRHFETQTYRLMRCGYLIRLDAQYHLDWAHRGLRMTHERDAELGRSLEGIIGCYEPIANLLGTQPAALVHNDLGRKNVLVDLTPNPARVCIIDWEMAGVGCAVHDLVHLRSDRLDPKTDAEIIAAYFEAMEGSSLIPVAADRRHILDACELHRTLYRLAHSLLWNKSMEYVADRVERAKRLLRRLA